MSAIDTIEDRAARLIEPFRQRYMHALAACREAAETTATIGWQTSYERDSAGWARTRKTLAKELEAVAEQIASRDMSFAGIDALMEDVTELAGVRKRIAGAAEDLIVWRMGIHRFAATVTKLDEIIAETMEELNRIREDESLFSEELASAAESIVDGWPRANWNATTGIIEIIEPVTAEEAQQA